mgnify:CR=1 FL=1
MISIGNAPCSWGVEFAGDPRNPDWRRVLADCSAAGYRGIELGPVGFMPEDPAVLGDALAQNDLTLIGGVVFRPFHDPNAWDDVWDGATRTCKALVAHGARHLVLIDSISPRRAPTAGRAGEAEQMGAAEWLAFADRIRTVRVRVVERPIPEGFVGADYEGDRDYRRRFQAWLNQMWIEKDLCLQDWDKEVSR